MVYNSYGFIVFRCFGIGKNANRSNGILLDCKVNLMIGEMMYKGNPHPMISGGSPLTEE